MSTSSYAAIEGAGALVLITEWLVLITEWDAFRALDLKRVKERVRTPLMVDLRNVCNPAEMRASGFTYASIGR